MADQGHSEESFKDLAEGLPQLIWTCRPDGYCDYLSRQWVEYTGRPEAQQLGSGWLDAVHPEDRDELMKAWNAAVTHKGKYDVEFRIRRHDGVYRWFKTRAIPLKDGNGNLIRWVGSNTDIEELRAAEQALRHSEAEYRTVVEALSEGIVTSDLDGKLLNWNRAALEMHGFSSVDEVRRHLAEFARIFELSNLDGTIVPFEHWPMHRVLRGEKLRDWQLQVRRKNSDWRRIYSYGGALGRDAKGRPLLAMLTIADITDQIDTQTSLQRAKELAEAASRAKDHFLAVVSHELRTPLTPVLAAASHLRTVPELPEPLREDVEMICRNVEMESRLVNDLLNLTRMARGKLVLHQESIDANALVRDIAKQFKAEFDARQIKVDLSLDPAKPYVWADPLRIRQVLGNLLGNAGKFASVGGRVAIRTAVDGANLQIQVIDDGIGIEPEVMARLFSPFEQGEQTITRRFGGLGLGLSIARQLVDLHGGTLAAQSAGRGCGATFTVSLKIAAPLPAAAVPESDGKKSDPPPSLSILLVEDHPDTLRIMSRLLEGMGHRVELASNVAEAVANSKGKTYDLLLSDIGLPDGSGLDVVRELRRRGACRRAVALSGFGQDEDVQRSIDAGFEAHLIKPLNVDLLRDALERHAGV